MKLEDVKKIYVERGKIFFAAIELTQHCNFKCRHCYCTDKHADNLPLKNQLEIIDKLADADCFLLSLTGGEILTHKNFAEIYTFAKQKGFLVDLVTNASLLTENHIALFKELPPNNISITLYGTSVEEYQAFTGDGDNFHKVMRALKLLSKNNFKFFLRTVATKTFQRSLWLGRFEALAAKFGADFRYDPIIFPKTSGEQLPLDECLSAAHIVELEKNNPLRKNAWIKLFKEDAAFNWRCKAGINSLTVDYKGDAFVCGLYRKNPVSILAHDITTVLNHLRQIHEQHLKIVESNSCSQCGLRRICKWCPAYSLLYNHNDEDKIKFFCDLAEARQKNFGG